MCVLIRATMKAGKKTKEKVEDKYSRKTEG